jgi:hypothetical protein
MIMGIPNFTQFKGMKQLAELAVHKLDEAYDALSATKPTQPTNGIAMNSICLSVPRCIYLPNSYSCQKVGHASYCLSI